MRCKNGHKTQSKDKIYFITLSSKRDTNLQISELQDESEEESDEECFTCGPKKDIRVFKSKKYEWSDVICLNFGRYRGDKYVLHQPELPEVINLNNERYALHVMVESEGGKLSN